jgi:hypothetical protein
MSEVLIVVQAGVEAIADSPITMSMVSALKSAIASSPQPSVSVQVVAAHTLAENNQWLKNWQSKDFIFCPLTLDLPDTLTFPSQTIIQACRDIIGLRQRVAQQLAVAIGDGYFWLPIVLTAKGPIYGEAIGLDETIVGEKLPEDLSLFISKAKPSSYYQPFHLSDALRQQLYQMGHQLLKFLSAPPATYLMQFNLQNAKIYFDRLWPFPAAPALASVGIQQPDLFTCHWYCLTGLPVLDMSIFTPVK